MGVPRALEDPEQGLQMCGDVPAALTGVISAAPRNCCSPCVLLPASQGCCQALGGEISRVLSLSGQLTLGVEQNPVLLPLQSPAEGSGREQGGIKTAMGVNSRIPPSTTCRCWEGKHPECVFFLDVYREKKVHGEQKMN